MAYYNRSPQKSYSRGYRRAPYGGSPRKTAPNGGTGSFDVNSESLDAPGPYISPDLGLAANDPLHHYVLRSGYYKGKTLAAVHLIKSNYVQWMKDKYYDTLPEQHILRKALDQFSQESQGAEVWTLPPLAAAPPRFREEDGKRHMYMQERYLKKTWNTTPEALVEAGVQYRVSEMSKTKAKKFALFQVYEYAKNMGGMNAKEADEAVHTEVARIMKTRANYNNFKSGAYSGYDAEDFCPFQCCA